MSHTQVAENPEGLSFTFEGSAYDIVRSAPDTGRNFPGKLSVSWVSCNMGSL